MCRNDWKILQSGVQGKELYVLPGTVPDDDSGTDLHYTSVSDGQQDRNDQYDLRVGIDELLLEDQIQDDHRYTRNR